MQSRAEPTADGGWVLDGEKQWITNGPYADLAIVFAVTDRERAAARTGGISAFLVPMSTPGAEVSTVLRLYGHVRSNAATLAFHDVPLPAGSLLGPQGDALALPLSGTSGRRAYKPARPPRVAARA